MTGTRLPAAPREFHELLDAAPDAMVVVDRQGLVAALNLEAQQFFGWTEPELLGEPISRFIPERFRELIRGYVEPESGPASFRTSTGVVSCFAKRRDGSEFPVELARRPLGGENLLSLVTFRDLTHWRRAREARSRDNENAQATLEAIGDAVITTDAETRITYLNPVAEHLTGWTSDEALGQLLDVVFSLISETDRHPVDNTAVRCLEAGRSVDLEDGVVLLRRDGTEVPIGDSAAPIRDRNGVAVGVVLVIQDESEKRRVGQRLSFEATHDALTGLINRREFERRLNRVVAELAGTGSEQVLLCLDLDQFKVVNDICGHAAGDELLRRLSSLFSIHLRKRDTLARLGGDEFAVLLEECPLAEGERIAEALRKAIENFRYECAGHTFTVGASVGLIPVTVEGGEVSDILRAADAACYAAKEAGGNRVHIERLGRNSPGMSQAVARRITRLARAADENHFQLYAQPIIAVQSEPGQRARVEILLRLPDGKGGMQEAAGFLPQAERYSLMPEIDRWVVRRTLGLLGQWHRERPDEPLPVCSINLSASALAGETLVTLVEQELARHGLPPGILCFEIAESAAMANLPRAVRFLSDIRSTGCEVALEDFGSGVASFNSLQALAVNFVKIGGHLIHGVADDPVCGSIVSAVNQIGRSMGVATIATQIGSDRALHKLRTLGIGYVQGRALRPPVPLTDAEGRMLMENVRQ